MAIRGKSINLYLMDGIPTGRIKCTLANWTGVSYKIPRTELEKCKGRDDLSQSGVYFLFGASDEQPDRDVVYVGQAGARKSGEGILVRLSEHKRNSEKDYWTEAVVFTTSNNSFGPTEISYLENRFYNLAKNSNRYDVKNGNDPSSGNVTEEKESELEEFIDYAKIVMGALGYKVFEPLTESKADNTVEDESNLLYLKRNSTKSSYQVSATCKQTSEGFVVLKGSRIELIPSSKVPPGVEKQRANATISEEGYLQEDVLFRSPSYAAAFVVGGHISGPREWKNADGIMLKDIESSELITW